MGALVTLALKECPHDVVTCDGDSLRERSHRLPRCSRCDAEVDWATLDERYAERR
jgi:dissimilatory sulfite reductase (desulfoviridin) alpha/beta subunit